METSTPSLKRPEKPSPDFPLFAHACGKWAKKIKGKLRYFGRWDNPDGALSEYEQCLKTDTVAVDDGVLTLVDAINAFLAEKDDAKNRGELAQSTFADYFRSGKALVEQFGRDMPISEFTPAHFANYREAMAARLSVISLGNEVTRVRVLFKWLWDSRLIDQPQHFGPGFKRPSKKLLRKHKREQGKKLYSAKQIRRLLGESGVHMRAMILLGINCGFGNTDVAMLRTKDVFLDNGWIHFPRPKTEVARSCPLWPETVKALRRSLRNRYTPREEAKDRFFVCSSGKPFNASAKSVTKRFRQIREWAGITKGGFYWLRHTFQTIADGARDQVAVQCIMGHAGNAMSDNYREDHDEKNLRAVAEHVRRWLYGNRKPASTAS